MTIKYLTFEISTNCNMDCGFCFSDWRNQTDKVNTKDAKKIIVRMKESGLKAINFTGGEPLLRKDLPELINFSKELDLTTILTTNGILLEKKINQFDKSIDFIGLPIDSSEEKVHNLMRPTKSVNSHYALVTDLVSNLHNNYEQIGVKINTIVTRQNYETLASIGNIIHNKVVSWKLSHFIASGYGKKYEDLFSISAKEYDKVAANCRLTHPDLKIISSRAHEDDSCCRIISAQGNLLQPTKNGLEDLGSLVYLNEKEMTAGFDERKNEYFLKNTYLSNKRGD